MASTFCLLTNISAQIADTDIPETNRSQIFRGTVGKLEIRRCGSDGGGTDNVTGLNVVDTKDKDGGI